MLSCRSISANLNIIRPGLTCLRRCYGSANVTNVQQNEATEQGPRLWVTAKRPDCKAWLWAKFDMKRIKTQNGYLKTEQLNKYVISFRKQKLTTADHFALLVSACGDTLIGDPQNKTKLAQSLFDSAPEKGVEVYNALLRVYLENNHQFSPEQFLKQMAANNVLPNSNTFETILKIYCMSNKLKEAEHVFKYMMSKSFVIHHTIFGNLAYAHCMLGDPSQAINMVQTTIDSSKTNLKSTWSIVTLLCFGLIRSGNTHLLEEVLHKYISQLPEFSSPCVKIINELANTNQRDMIPTVIGLCKQFKPDHIIRYAAKLTPEDDVKYLRQMLENCYEDFTVENSALLCRSYLSRFSFNDTEEVWKQLAFLKSRIPESESELEMTYLCILLENEQYENAAEFMSQMKERNIDFVPSLLQPALKQVKGTSAHARIVGFLNANGIHLKPNKVSDKNAPSSRFIRCKKLCNDILQDYFYEATELDVAMGKLSQAINDEVITQDDLKRFFMWKCNANLLTTPTINKMVSILQRLGEEGNGVVITEEEAKKYLQRESHFLCPFFSDPPDFKFPKFYKSHPRFLYLLVRKGLTNKILHTVHLHNLSEKVTLQVIFDAMNHLPTDEVSQIIAAFEGRQLPEMIINAVFWHHVLTGNVENVNAFLRQHEQNINFDIDVLPKPIAQSLTEEVETILLDHLAKTITTKNAVWLIYFSYIHAGETLKAKRFLEKYDFSCSNQLLSRHMNLAGQKNSLKKTTQAVLESLKDNSAVMSWFHYNQLCRSDDFEWIESATSSLLQQQNAQDSLKMKCSVLLFEKCDLLGKTPPGIIFLDETLNDLAKMVLNKDMNVQSVIQQVQTVIESNSFIPGVILGSFLKKLNPTDFQEATSALSTIYPQFKPELRFDVIMSRIQQLINSGKHMDAAKYLKNTFSPQTNQNYKVWKQAMLYMAKSAVASRKPEVLQDLMNHSQINANWNQMLTASLAYHDAKYKDIDLKKLSEVSIALLVNEAKDVEVFERLLTKAAEVSDNNILLHYLKFGLRVEEFTPTIKAVFSKLPVALKMKVVELAYAEVNNLCDLKKVDKTITELQTIYFKDPNQTINVFFNFVNWQKIMQNDNGADIIDLCLEKYYSGLPYQHAPAMTNYVLGLMYRMQFKIEKFD